MTPRATIPPRGGFPARAFFVGVTHGMAGSAALLLLALQGSSLSPRPRYIALFGLGSILGMATLLVITVPLRLSARLFAPVYRGLEAVVGVATVAIGVRVLWNLRW